MVLRQRRLLKSRKWKTGVDLAQQMLKRPPRLLRAKEVCLLQVRLALKCVQLSSASNAVKKTNSKK